MVDQNENRADDNRIDEPTGTGFVGHEWDGIEELDTPMPRWWLWTLYATIVWAVIYVVLYPAWPMIEKGTEGVLGWTSRGQLAEEMSAADLARADIYAQIGNTPLEQLPDNASLMNQAIAGGSAAFKVNCVQCHGAGAAGSQGYPNLNDDDWLWGGTLTDIEYTLVHGIRWDGSDGSRASYMPAFDGIFDNAQVDGLVGHVLSFTGKGESTPAGAELYEVNCVGCHQANGTGDPMQGAPALNDAIWLYGESETQIRQQILNPSHGVMPGWGGRLDPVTIKMLAAYVHSRGGGQQPAAETEPEPAVANAAQADEDDDQS